MFKKWFLYTVVLFLPPSIFGAGEISAAPAFNQLIEAANKSQAGFLPGRNNAANAGALTWEYPSDSLAELVGRDSLCLSVYRLEAFQTRHFYSDSIHAVRDWIRLKFQSLGYDSVYFDTFYIGRKACQNVYCVKPGSVEPENIIVVGANYDSYNTQSDPKDYAPGADNNASGMAAVLELARVFSLVETRKTMIFVAFSAGEAGLAGAEFAAAKFREQKARIEFMLDFNRIGNNSIIYNHAEYWGSELTYGYCEALGAAFYRTTSIGSYIFGCRYEQGLPSSFHAFTEHEYPSMLIMESDWALDRWNTDFDIWYYLDFDFMAQVVRGAAASLGFIDQAAHTTDFVKINDIGNGHALRITWGEYNPLYTYYIYYGTSPWTFTDTLAVPAGNALYDLDGLSEGQTYYFCVEGKTEWGRGQIDLVQASEKPLLFPRTPGNFRADPDSAAIVLTWNPSVELDFGAYQIFRRVVGAEFMLYHDNYKDTILRDIDVFPQILYEYFIQASDLDQNYSPVSDTFVVAAATFNYGILLANEFDPGGWPPEEAVAGFYDGIFADTSFTVQNLNASQDTFCLSRSIAGQYSTIFWIDDDWNYHLFSNSTDSLAWFLGFETNLFLAGYESVSWLTGIVPQHPGDFAHDYFGINRVEMNQSADFSGALGRPGWPDLHVNPNAGLGAALPSVSVIDPLPGTRVIYTYDSRTDNPAFEGRPTGVAFYNGRGKGIALTFPLYYLDTADTRALINRALVYFQDIETTPGDLNGDNRVTIIDILFLMAYLFHNGASPDDINQADVNQDCQVNMMDPLYMIAYKFRGGPAPSPGCVRRD